MDRRIKITNVSMSCSRHKKDSRIFLLLTFFEGEETVEKVEIFCMGVTHSQAFCVELGRYHALHGVIDVEYKDAPGLKWIFSLTPEGIGIPPEKKTKQKNVKSEKKVKQT